MASTYGMCIISRVVGSEIHFHLELLQAKRQIDLPFPRRPSRVQYLRIRHENPRTELTRKRIGRR